MLNRIDEYTDEQDKSPYAEWLTSLRDARAKARIVMQVDRKAYWQEYKRRK